MDYSELTNVATPSSPNVTFDMRSLALARRMWRTVAMQIEYLLGEEIYAQWFKNVEPLGISDHTLILKPESDFHTHWINNHYQDLVDLFLSVQDSTLTSFFISPKDAPPSRALFE
jgi:chromosomal replication initiation ATPase DnaA